MAPTLKELTDQNEKLQSELLEAQEKVTELTNAAATTAQAHAEQIKSLEEANAALEEKISAFEKQVKHKMTKKSRLVIRAKLIDEVARLFHGKTGQSNTERATTAVDHALEVLFPEKAAAEDDEQ